MAGTTIARQESLANWKNAARVRVSDTTNIGAISLGENVLGLVTTKGGTTVAALLGAGTSAAPVTTTSASKNFVSFITKSTATSGYSYGLRSQFYIAGAAGGGAAMRPYTIISGVAGKSAYGVEATAEISTTAGSSVDADEMATIKATATVGLSTTGTVSCMNLRMNIATGKTVHANSSFIDVSNSGAVVQPVLFNFDEAAGAAGAVTSLICTDHANDITANRFIRCMVNGTPTWIMATTTAPAAS